jgi:hypothetical protein
LSRFSFCGVALRVCGSIDGCAYSVDVINTLAVSASRFTSCGVVRAAKFRVSPGQVIFVAGSIPGSPTIKLQVRPKRPGLFQSSSRLR